MQKIKFIKIVACLLVCFFLSNVIYAQDLLKGKDLSQIKVDQLSDADIAKFNTQLNVNNLTIDQAEQMALSRGMSQLEFNKLRDRLQKLTSNNNSSTGRIKLASSDEANKNNNSPNANQRDSLNYERKPRPLIDSLIFGSELYTSVAPSFEPNLNLATPVNYVLGPSDQIQVTVYGIQEYSGDLLISPDGNVFIPNVGQVKVAGMTIEAATQKLKLVMGNSVYSYLKTGGAKISVTLSKMRSIRVTIIGANRPGNFTISSLATVFNALFVSGGPSVFGSFRQIELIRDNRVINTIDLYRFLLHGDQSDDIGLKDNDVIRIPPYKTRVEIQGQVKRPGIFEVLPGETFANIIQFASGFTDTAYKASVKVFQRTDRERTVHDLAAADFSTYIPQTGDVFVASKILNRFGNRVRITGAVYRPEVYELSPGLKVADLIRKADGLKEDAFTGRGQILRYEDDLTRSILSFDVKRALAGNPSDNLPLKREDEVLVSSILDLRDSLRVQIRGEIRKPGDYEYVEKLTLRDLVLQAGGFTDAAYKSVEIARLIRRDSIAATDNNANIVLNTDLNGELSGAAGDIILQPFDVITIRRRGGYVLPELVTVSGQVQYPGPYALQRMAERVSDVLKRAGGFTPDANPAGAYVKRYKTTLEKSKSEDVARKVQKTTRDTSSLQTLTEEIMREFDQIPLNMDALLKSPGSVEDIILRSKDELVIPKFDAQVKISGEVLMATQVTFQSKNSFLDYISDAGGYTANAMKRKSYIVYANGRAASTKHFLFFKFYPKVLPGSEIVIPKRSERKGLSTSELIGITTALASLTAILLSIK